MPFDVTEAKDLISIAANLEGPTPPLSMPVIPGNWGSQPIFDSPVMGAFDNKWQLWANPSAAKYAVVIRGTTAQSGSIFEDLMAVMIPASGTLPLNSVNLPYKLAADSNAAVHLGFALGMGILLFDGVNGILTQLLQTVPDEAEVLIAGHSQGAAIATLCRSFLEYSGILATKNFAYKTYLYAQPKPGNDHYGRDFDRIASNRQTGFCITNSQDWVPQVPLTLQLLGSLNTPNPLNTLTGGTVFRMFSKGIEDLQDHLQEIHLAKHLPQIQALEQTLQKQNLQATVSPVAKMDITIAPTLNFTNCGTAITLAGTHGGNPNDPNDFFWQHHAAMYYNLLNTVFP